MAKVPDETTVAPLGRLRCYYFQQGRCRQSQGCPFVHDFAVTARPPVCVYWEASGECRYGERCQFFHDLESQPEAPAAGSGGGERSSAPRPLRSPRASRIDGWNEVRGRGDRRRQRRTDGPWRQKK